MKQEEYSFQQKVGPKFKEETIGVLYLEQLCMVLKLGNFEK